MKIKVLDVKVIGFCSKCIGKFPREETPRYKDGSIVPDENIKCLNCCLETEVKKDDL